MKICIITAAFPPEPIVSAQTGAQVAYGFSIKKHQVLVISSFPSRPAGKLFPGHRRSLYRYKNSSEGYKIIRCFSFFSKKSSILNRTMEYLSFGITSSLALLFSEKPDVIYANTWPIFAQGLVCLVARLKKIPLVLSVQDIYPESLVCQGRIRENGWVFRILLAIDRVITRRCSSVIVISDRFTHSYSGIRGIPLEKIKVVPNWIDSQAVRLTPKEKYRQRSGISKEAFVLVYGGNIGMAADVETVIKALEYVKSEREIVLIVAGSGSNLQTCQILSGYLSNARVIFHTPWPIDETAEVLGAADVLVLPTHGNQSLVSVPSKMLSYLLSARPILATVSKESDIAEVIGKTGCGWVVPPDMPELLARKIEEVSKISEDQLIKLGQSGREFALQNLVSEICLPKVIEAILSAVKA